MYLIAGYYSRILFLIVKNDIHKDKIAPLEYSFMNTEMAISDIISDRRKEWTANDERFLRYSMTPC